MDHRVINRPATGHSTGSSRYDGSTLGRDCIVQLENISLCIGLGPVVLMGDVAGIEEVVPLFHN